ncbi:TPA: Rha family transcriptional regulator [Clostridioides difficile]|uniref:Transcriptional regulator n=1 Tax=Clostridium phage CDKM15 TaxID=1868595 RepID=A0A3G1E3I7_9CAUD|nr:Rha family transcriptional regulator [Clostridioides difficile]YP_009830920.1 anti-repressor Ant [Clostridium phage CDKM15]EQI44150.1 phage regulatory, Rha family protein [Clostridioides difficile Y184]QVW56759.1 Rha family protein [Clostridioides phage phiCD418]ANT45192.1 transcriptional regulator [Clostridium phage CDKM15]EGT3650522.1 Rha family transcriptional regulator [Clostridioides difficile]EGT3930052.1 Rha family transcriptional regulator [Clostridioides difficile]
MKNLTIIKQNNQFLVESREVAELIEKKHDNLLRDIRGYKKILEDSSNLKSQDFFIESTYINTQNKIQPCYLLTKKGCDMVANKMTGEKGIIFTAIYVTKFEEMERELKEQQPKLPTTYKEALQQLLIEVEEKEQLQLENQVMKPKADYFDALVERNLLTNIRDTAKELGVKEKTFVLWLIEKKYCYRDLKGKIKPYSNKMQYFELKEFTTPYGHSDTQTLINPKGREAFRLLLIKDGLVKEKEYQITLLG